jgi:hypothetical protein
MSRNYAIHYDPIGETMVISTTDTTEKIEGVNPHTLVRNLEGDESSVWGDEGLYFTKVGFLASKHNPLRKNRFNVLSPAKRVATIAKIEKEVA